MLDLLSAHSCRGRRKLRGGLPQGKESDRRAIGALHLDPHTGEAVMLRPQDPTTFTSTAPYRHSLSPSRPRPPARRSAGKARSGPSARKTERQRPRPKRDSDTGTNRVTGNSTLRKNLMLTFSAHTSWTALNTAVAASHMSQTQPI